MPEKCLIPSDIFWSYYERFDPSDDTNFSLTLTEEDYLKTRNQTIGIASDVQLNYNIF